MSPAAKSRRLAPRAATKSKKAAAKSKQPAAKSKKSAAPPKKPTAAPPPKKSRAAAPSRPSKPSQPAAAALAPFTGFDRAAPGFFHELAAEQSREWFAAHKDAYLALWHAPMMSLLADVARALAPAYAGLTLGAPKIFRIQRDVRFSNDKSPYKTHIGGYLPVTAGAKPTEGPVALYVSFGLEEYAGAGTYIFEAEQLARWRRLVGDDRTGREIAGLVAAACASGGATAAGEVLQRVPKPFDADHPRGELLRHKGLVVGFPDIPRGLIHEAGLVDWLAAHARAAAPVVRWLTKRVALA